MTVTLSPKARRIQKALRGPQPVAPVPDATEMLQEAARLAQAAWTLLDKAGRSEDCFQLQTTINDLNYRHIPRSIQTACTDCIGYRGEMTVGASCRHEVAP